MQKQESKKFKIFVNCSKHEVVAKGFDTFYNTFLPLTKIPFGIRSLKS